MAQKGRPKGSTNIKKKSPTKKNTIDTILSIDTEKVYTCSRCGEQTTDPVNKFYLCRQSLILNGNNYYSNICRSCANDLFDNLKIKFKDEKIAFIIMCHYLDFYYDESLYESFKTREDFGIGLYSRQLGLAQHKNKSFMNNVINMIEELDLYKDSSEIRESKETKWKTEDTRNKQYSISCVGYDPFDDESLSDEERKYLFNILAGYFNDDTVKSDHHKIQCVIQLSQTHLQCKKIDDFINTELMNKSPDEKRIRTLSSTKKDLLDGISKVVKDNNLSSNYSLKSQKGSGTLSGKIKELEKDNFEAIKVNLFNIKTCEAMKQIADLSHQSILEQIGFDSNDYTDMIKEQRELIRDYELKTTELDEENRILKNKLKDYELKSR